MRRVLVAPAFLAALTLAACGGSSPPASTPAAATSPRPAASGGAPLTSSTTSPSAATSSPGTPATTTSATSSDSSGGGSSGGADVSGPPPCRAAGLALSFLGGQGATGHGELGFSLRNTTSAPCSTGGYPGILFLSAGGGQLATTPEHTTSDFFGQLPERSLVVAPGQSVSFRLGVSHGEGSSGQCATASALQVIPPNDTATLVVPIPNGASECGTTTVSPVQPGNSAYQ